MGKRKERRLAAKTAANRRVKLDLLAEPSGDFGDSSNKEEVGGGGNAKIHARSPNSPSSSGQRPENPLLLLGQYSDEELEEESGKEISRDTGENSPAELDEQVKVDSHEGTGADKDENLTAHIVVDLENKDHSSSLDVLPKLEGNGVIEDDTVESLHKDMDAVEQTSVPWTCDTQTTGDVNSGWKMVLHEESNSYYYWNTVTGETSWEVPVVLGQGNESAYDPKSAPEVEERHVTSVDTHMPNATLDAEMDASVATQPNNGSTNTLVSEASEIDGFRSELEVNNEKYTDIMANDKDEGNHVNTIDGRKTSSPDDVNYVSSHGGFAGHSNDALSNGEAHHSDPSIQDMRDHVNQGTVGDPSSDSFRLLQLGENLLERLKSLKGSEGFNDQISNLMFELDIRLADIKSLVPYGSSLLPFWLHSEDQLKKLEAAVNSEVLKCSQFANIGELNEAENKLQENICEATANENIAASTSLEFDASDHASISKEAEKVLSGAPDVRPQNDIPTRYPYLFVDSTAQGEIVEAHENIPADIVPNVGLHSVEDVDMDVEMEVEDAIPFEDVSGVQNGAQLNQSIPPNPEAQHESLGSEEEFDVPPPPGDEWIPPPPPDDEPLPPPPPDEPPEAPFPPPPLEMQTGQPYSYGEQYNFTYPGSSFEYYGQTNTEVPSNDYYVDANGCQVAAPIPTLYYAAAPNPYPDATSVVNPGEPVTYYTLQEGSAPAAPVIGGVETSGLHKSVHESIASDQTNSMAAWKDRPLLSQVDVSAVGREIGNPSTEVPSISASIHAPATSTVTCDVSVVPAPADATMVAPTEPVPKVQPKVSRNKKRTVAAVPSLRSNKKVSGLVDKWKAVKEELHEDEDDEPENTYEVLEKKRQREIQQWHAQQIATGEAKDNANFQPLGGDWRERVRRKRAKKSIEAEENLAKGIDDTNQQPDLVELSRQLPFGWQAYWDETSKQVYYGNSTTSETTWIKPTN